MVSKQKILIVDDDNNIAELISLYLTKECFDTRIVNDGEEALKTFDTYRPNLILLDLMLPGIDGYQVCREIRHKSNVPIIMLSAKEKSLTKFWDWSWAQTTISSNPSNLQRTGRPGQSRAAALSAPAGAGIQTCRKVCGIPGSCHQPDELLCTLPGAEY